jgi:hypothetical protein
MTLSSPPFIFYEKGFGDQIVNAVQKSSIACGINESLVHVEKTMNLFFRVICMKDPRYEALLFCVNQGAQLYQNVRRREPVSVLNNIASAAITFFRPAAYPFIFAMSDYRISKSNFTKSIKTTLYAASFIWPTPPVILGTLAFNCLDLAKEARKDVISPLTGKYTCKRDKISAAISAIGISSLLYISAKTALAVWARR